MSRGSNLGGFAVFYAGGLCFFYAFVHLTQALLGRFGRIETTELSYRMGEEKHIEL